MGKNSKIEWCDHTFNPWWGCEKISDGCTNCYAEVQSEKNQEIKIWGKLNNRRFFGENHWKEPLKWNRSAEKNGKPQKVFCGSMCDIMEDREDLVEQRKKLFSLIEKTPNLYWLLLTKRPQNFARFLPDKWLNRPIKNVWLGTTVENQDNIWRIKYLKDTPAAIRFLSIEPLLGEVDLSNDLVPLLHKSACSKCGHTDDFQIWKQLIFKCPKCGENKWGYPKHIHWVIVGGESGQKARIMNPKWVKKIQKQCEETKIPFFFKQWGEWILTENGFEKVGRKNAGCKIDELEFKETPDFLLDMIGII